jgi:hypothetical protein
MTVHSRHLRLGARRPPSTVSSLRCRMPTLVTFSVQVSCPVVTGSAGSAPAYDVFTIGPVLTPDTGMLK